ncbi:short chain type dehydrogenase [Cladophialophora carrionii]|uniref:Short chain type dehydrogenase n=1 Tax=Cladophialophora carrionii TaxID=86049 RepID=A0A1C1CH38_9EURO|nr:short chain type dehydrogenase [Cladophialophora carrionii]
MENAGLTQVPPGQCFQTRSTSTSNKALATKLGASSEDAYRSRTIQDMMSLKGRVTVVTGGARGIGLALARGAAELGSDIAVLDVLEKPSEAFEDFEKELGVQARYYRASVTDPEGLTRGFEAIVKDFGQIDNWYGQLLGPPYLLPISANTSQSVTAAGIVHDKPFLDTTWEEGARILEVNVSSGFLDVQSHLLTQDQVMGTMLSAQLAAKQMRAQNTGGSIVMIASVSAGTALQLQRLNIYAASKGAVKSLCGQLAVELAPLGIRVNTVSPGFIATEMTKGLAVTRPELLTVFKSPPLGRIGDRADLKGVVGYLLSDAAAYTTGTDVLVTGGVHAGLL